MRQTATQSRTPESRLPTRRCEEEDCAKCTREGKPYCSDHVLEVDYAKALSAKINGIEDEVRQVGVIGPRRVDINGVVVEEILAGIVHAGQITWRRLCKDHVAFFNKTEAETTDHYLTRLRAERLVTVSLNKRGVEVVELTPMGLLTAQRRFK